MFLKKKNFNNTIIGKFYFLLILFLPGSIIIGNFAINLNVLLIDIIFLLFIFKISDLKLLFSKKNFIYIVFINLVLFLFILNLINSFDPYLSFKSLLGFIRYLILSIALVYFFSENQNNIYKFSLTIFCFLAFVVADTLFQYIFGKDFFGFETIEWMGGRLSGPFGDELVVGAYITKLFCLSFFFLVIKKNNCFLKLIFLFLLILMISTVFLTLERSATILAFLSTLFILFFLKFFSIRDKILIFISFLLISFLIVNFNKNVYNQLIVRTSEQLSIKQSDLTHEKNFKSIMDNQWAAHFLTAYEIFLDNKFLGSGIKTFRVVCGNEKYSNIKSENRLNRCNTHPHNLYLEFLSELGLLITFLIVTFLFFLLIKNIQQLLITARNKCHHDQLILSLGNLFVLFFPLQTSGAFFSTFNGVFYWIGLSFNVYLLFFYKAKNVTKK